jgi:hypothetical protein
MSKVQRATPLSAVQYLKELGYYAQMGETYAENYRKEEFNIKAIPKRFHQDLLKFNMVNHKKISVYRWLNENCSKLMFEIMKSKFDTIYRIDALTLTPIYWDLKEKEIYHLDCVEKPNDTTTYGVATLFGDKEFLKDCIDTMDSFMFCNGCGKFIFPNGIECLDQRVYEKEKIKLAEKHKDLKNIFAYEDRSNDKGFHISVEFDAYMNITGSCNKQKE